MDPPIIIKKIIAKIWRARHIWQHVCTETIITNK